MTEISYIDELKKFAKDNGLNCSTNRDIRKHVALVGNPYTKYEYVVMDLPRKDKNMHLVFSDTRTGNAGGSYAYCGLFLKIPVCKNEVKIRPRFFIDRFSSSKRHKTDNSFIDKKVTIFKSNNESIPFNTESTVIRKFLELNSKLGPLELVSICKSMSFIPLLYGNNWLAIQLKRRWLFEPDQINRLIEMGSDVLLKAKINI
ncbi:MAG: hypothetical protein R2764_24860 [Bacteroidales bacterium]